MSTCFLVNFSVIFSVISESYLLISVPYSFHFLENYFFTLITVYNNAKFQFCWNNAFYWFARSMIMSTPAYPAAFTISDTTSDGPTAFLFFILLIESLTMQLSITLGMPLTLSAWNKLFQSHANSKVSHDSFSKLFSIFIIECKYTIIISHALITNNIVISFDHPLCNFKHVTFLMDDHSVSISFPFCFT